MFFMSGSQGNAFAIAAQSMTERIHKLGPNPLRKTDSDGDDQDIEVLDEGFRGRPLASN